MTIEKVRRLHKRLDKMGEHDPYYFDHTKTGLTPQQLIDEAKKNIPPEIKAALEAEKLDRNKQSQVETEKFLKKRQAELDLLDAEDAANNAKF